jgi:hypothetical protein
MIAALLAASAAATGWAFHLDPALVSSNVEDRRPGATRVVPSSLPPALIGHPVRAELKPWPVPTAADESDPWWRPHPSMLKRVATAAR